MARKSILLAMVVLLVACGWAAAYSGGTGEPNDPYRICTAEDMNAIGADPNDWDAHFLVICDINLADYTGTQFNMIGNYGNRFTGVFDGNDHTISNFTYECTNTDYIGIFGYVDDVNAIIKDLTLIDPNVNAGTSYLDGHYVGSFVGDLGSGTIVGCCVEGGSVSGYQSVGGMVGDNSGLITNCHSTGNVSGTLYYIGGLVGDNDGTITNCYSTGSVTGEGGAVGGLVGYNSGTITDCYSTIDVSGTGLYGNGNLGGLVASNSGTITNCYSTGNVSGTRSPIYGVSVGGLVASNSGTITGCYSTSNVSGRSFFGGENSVGGLVARNSGMITNCYATGNVSGTETGRYYIGGLVGGNDESGEITYCYSTGSVSISGAYAYGYVGGLVGYGGGTVSSFWDIEISGCNTSAGGAHKTTAEMKMASTYIGWGGCGNGYVWTIDDEHDYPRLAWEGKPGQLIGEQQLSDYIGGSGEPNDPYLISNDWQFNLIGAFPCEWDKHFELVADVNLADYTRTRFNIIGVQPCRPFTGVFDGNDKIIWNFTWDSNGVSYIGLFGYVDTGGQIKNLGMENVNINVANGDYVGGLVGYNYEGPITNCYSSGSVSGDERVGGLVGYNNYGTVTRCYTTGNVTGTSSGNTGVGGLVASNHSGTITNCYSTCSVSGHGGGLVGNNSGTITNCYSTGDVNGSSDDDNENFGGLVASNSGTIMNCYSTGDVNGIACDECYAAYVGGLVGRNSSYGMITNCYSTGDVSGNVPFGNYVGGLVGVNCGGTITNCYAVGNVSGDYPVGGLVGDNGGTITNCYSDANVTGENDAGGLVGRNSGPITNCYSTGSIWGDFDAGGLVGENDVGTITNCYSTGDVNGTGEYYLSSVGGLVGGNNAGTISNSYATGSVSGGGRIGGLVGRIYSGTVSASFWDVNTTGQSSSAGGTPKTTAEMKTRSTFTNAGWDFIGETVNGPNDYWRMCVNDVNYPLLSWQFVPDFVCPDGVDIFDLALFVERWLNSNCNLSDNNFCNCTDINCDEIVNFRDFAIFASRWVEGI